MENIDLHTVPAALGGLGSDQVCKRIFHGVSTRPDALTWHAVLLERFLHPCAGVRMRSSCSVCDVCRMKRTNSTCPRNPSTRDGVCTYGSDAGMTHVGACAMCERIRQSVLQPCMRVAFQ